MDNQEAKPDPSWNLNLWRIVRECRSVASQYGFSGDALNDNKRAGSFEQERWIIGLTGAIDGRVAKLNRSFASRIIRNIVLNTGQ